MDVTQVFAKWPRLGIDGIPMAVERIESSKPEGKCYRLLGGSVLNWSLLRRGKKGKLFFIDMYREVGRARVGHYSPHMIGAFGMGTREDAFLADCVSLHAAERVFSAGFRGSLGPIGGSEAWCATATEEDTPLVVKAFVSLDVGFVAESFRYLELPCGPRKRETYIEEAVERFSPARRLIDDVRRFHDGLTQNAS